MEHVYGPEDGKGSKQKSSVLEYKDRIITDNEKKSIPVNELLRRLEVFISYTT